MIPIVDATLNNLLRRKDGSERRVLKIHAGLPNPDDANKKKNTGTSER